MPVKVKIKPFHKKTTTPLLRPKPGDGTYTRRIELKSNSALDRALVLNLAADHHSAILYLDVHSSTPFRVSLDLRLRKTAQLRLKILIRAFVDNFKVDLLVKGVLFDTSQLEITTDTLLRAQTIESGYINVQERFILHNKAILLSTPKFSLLPGGIEQIHGMVVYSLSHKEEYFLGCRGFDPVRARALVSL